MVLPCAITAAGAPTTASVARQKRNRSFDLDRDALRGALLREHERPSILKLLVESERGEITPQFRAGEKTYDLVTALAIENPPPLVAIEDFFMKCESAMELLSSCHCDDAAH